MADVVVKDLVQSGAQSATWFVSGLFDAPFCEIIIGQSDIATLPSGKLKTVLTASYYNDVEFVRAFATAGGSVVATTKDDDNIPTVGLTVSDGKPIIRLSQDAARIGASSIRVSVSYSASE